MGWDGGEDFNWASPLETSWLIQGYGTVHEQTEPSIGWEMK